MEDDGHPSKCHRYLQKILGTTAASALWVANEQGLFEAYIPGITPINVFYFIRKEANIARAQRAVRSLLATTRICAIDIGVLQVAHSLLITDYEDAVQHASATASGMDAIIIRNLEDYRRATLPIFSPAAFLAQLPNE